MRFVLLFSYIIPLSLRVNLDIGKAAYSFMIQRDKDIEGTVVRSTTIPEDLGVYTLAVAMGVTKYIYSNFEGHMHWLAKKHSSC